MNTNSDFDCDLSVRYPAEESEIFLFRRGGLDFNLLSCLKVPSLIAWSERVEELREDERRARDAFQAVLKKIVAETTSASIARSAKNLRRTVRAGGTLDRAGLNLSRLCAAYPNLATHVDAVESSILKLSSYLDLGESVAELQVRRVREEILRFAKEPRLRKGILLQSNELDHHLDRITGVPNLSEKRMRKIEQTILKYLYRAAAKTSPFGTLGVVGLGSFVMQPLDSPSLVEVDLCQGTSSSGEMNLALLGHIIHTITETDGMLIDVPLELNKSVLKSGLRYRYVRRSRVGPTDSYQMGLSPRSESVFFLGAEGIIQRVVQLMGDGRKLQAPDIVNELLFDSGVTASVDEILDYIRALVKVGFLVSPIFSVDLANPRPATDFALRLAKIGSVWAQAVSEHILSLQSLVNDYVNAESDSRRILDERMRVEVRGIESAIGVSSEINLTSICFEDVADRGTVCKVDNGWWTHEVLPTLEICGRFLSLFDRSASIRLALKAYFLARYGAGGVVRDVTGFLDEFRQDCFEELQRALLRHRDYSENLTVNPLPNWFDLDDVKFLDDSKQRLQRFLQGAVDQCGPEPWVLELDRNWLNEFLRDMPETAPIQPDPRSFFLQMGLRGNNPYVVINKSYCGMGLQFSRFSKLLDSVVDYEVIDRVRSRNTPFSDSVLMAELRGGMDTTNLNAHPHLTGYELLCPGETSERPVSEQIDLCSLVLKYDPHKGVILWSDERRARVVPVYLGFLLPYLLSPIQQELLLLSPVNMAMPNFFEGVKVNGFRYPRLTVGGVVLQRRTWRFPKKELPDTHTNMKVSARYLLWRDWKRANGIPDQVFLQPQAGRSVDDGEVNRARLNASTKPLFVDFDSEISVRLFDRAIANYSDPIEIVEMLPNPNELLVDRSSGKRYVTEFICDINPPRSWSGMC